MSRSWGDKRRGCTRGSCLSEQQEAAGRAPGGPRMRPAPLCPGLLPVKSKLKNIMESQLGAAPTSGLISPHKFVHHDPRQPSSSEAPLTCRCRKRGHRGERTSRTAPELGARQGQGSGVGPRRLGVSSRKAWSPSHTPIRSAVLTPVVCGREGGAVTLPQPEAPLYSALCMRLTKPAASFTSHP